MDSNKLFPIRLWHYVVMLLLTVTAAVLALRFGQEKVVTEYNIQNVIHRNVTAFDPDKDQRCVEETSKLFSKTKSNAMFNGQYKSANYVFGKYVLTFSTDMGNASFSLPVETPEYMSEHFLLEKGCNYAFIMEDWSPGSVGVMIDGRAKFNETVFLAHQYLTLIAVR